MMRYAEKGLPLVRPHAAVEVQRVTAHGRRSLLLWVLPCTGVWALASMVMGLLLPAPLCVVPPVLLPPRTVKDWPSVLPIDVRDMPLVPS